MTRGWWTKVGGAVGAVSGSVGAVTVSGTSVSAGSVWLNSGGLNVGGSGVGRLDITDMGFVQTDNGFIGRDAGSTGVVHVDGSGSDWGSSGLTVGDAGDGELNITAGGSVQSVDGFVAGSAGSTGVVDITGTNSEWRTTDTFHVGVAGHGTVNVTAGGQLFSENAVIGVESGSVGEVTVDGVDSMWTNNGLIFVSSFAPGTGTLTVINGGVLSSQGGVIVRVLGTLRGDGQIIGNVGNVGVVAPGLSPGTLHVTGNFTQVANGVLEIELAGTTPGSEFDQLLVSGAVAIDGTLAVSLTGGFVPAAGMAFDVLDWSSLSGSFDTITLPALSAGLAWNTSQLLVTGSLSVGLPGDFNADDAVNAADYVIWRKGLGTVYTPTDYNTWRAHFGQTAGSGSGATADVSSNAPPVPEPASLLLVGLSVAMARCRSRCARAFIARCL